MKLIKIISAAAFLLAFSASAVFAANNVSEIGIDVTVRDDGSAVVVQNWHGEFDEGTENYIPIATSDISVSNLSVSDEDGKYSFVNDWNVDAEFEDKARKCGFNETKDGVELCFGISEYGEKNYTISYTVDDFIKSYTDFDGTNFMFINPDMSTFPTDASINIALENGTKLSAENSAIWAFGYDGNIEFNSGEVRAETTGSLVGSDSMIVMLRLNKGLITPKTAVDTSFETVKNKAFEGSDYGTEEDVGIFGMIIGFLIFVVLFALLVWVVVFLVKRKKAIGGFYKSVDYFRDVPNDKKIELSHYLAQNFDVADDESLIIGALMLSMINNGSLEPQIEENVGLFGKVKENVNLKLIKPPENFAELRLYNLLLCSAGEDGILQEKELERYFYRNPEQINDFIDEIKKSGEREFVSEGGFLGRAGNCIKDLSEKGKSELAEIMGLKKYLEDFTLISERSIAETVIWKDYLVYATLFGISDKVLKQLKKLYPERLSEIERYNRNVVIATGYYHSMYASSQRAIQERRTNGGGGRTSIGGGGGFSGGGSGGGSR